jgi:hypothetical protein
MKDINTLIKKEADVILYKKGLHGILQKYGEVKVGGSYILNLMTWRDLDIYLVNDKLAVASFFELGKQMAEILSPVKMHYRNERISKSKSLPEGLYWGTYLGDERKDSWKIDVWCLPYAQWKNLNKGSEQIKSQLTPRNRKIILEIKERCWRQPAYRFDFTSIDIYDAVLEQGITNYKDFAGFIKKHKGVILAG